MKNRFCLIFAIVLLCVTFCYSSEPITPAELLKTIYALALQEDYNAIETYIYPHHDTRKQVVLGIREKKTSGDWAYSNESLKEILDKHLDKLKPIPESLLKQLFFQKGDWSDDDKLANIAKTHPQDITIFDYKDVHIIIIKVEQKYKLLFWERLPESFGKDEKTAPNKVPENIVTNAPNSRH